MSTVRQDAWSSDEDLILAEVVLRHIREGSTQLAAFEEVGERLNRTSAACGFRWNSTIRKKYAQAIELAKKQRKKAISQKEAVPAENPIENIEEELAKENDAQEISVSDSHQLTETEAKKEQIPNITLQDVIFFLQNLANSYGETNSLALENERLLKENQQLQDKNKQLEKEIEQVKKERDIIQEDYRLLINIMERARKMAANNEKTNEMIEK